MMGKVCCYNASERESLEIVFDLKKRRVFFLSTIRFNLMTDHDALRYALQKKDMNGRLVRWMDFSAE